MHAVIMVKRLGCGVDVPFLPIALLLSPQYLV